MGSSSGKPAGKVRLGDRLIARGLIDESQLQVALGEQRRAHRPLGVILVSLGFLRQVDLARLQAEDLGLELVQAKEVEPDELVLTAVDRDFVRRVGAFPIELRDGFLRVAMVDPADPEKVSEVRERLSYPLRLAVTTEADLGKLMQLHLPEREGLVAGLMNELKGRAAEYGDHYPVERMVMALLIDGVHRGSTDVHLEPEENVTRVRYRIDGILQQGENLPRDATEAIVSRVKILAGMDIAERRRPQDGRIRISVDDREVDLRASVMPCVHGENVVLRILDRTAGGLKLSDLGIAPGNRRLLECIGDRSHGLFLVTGPTGSGKTTTLYSLLGTIDAMHRNVATVEDPVEYRMPLVRQSQVDTSIGFHFQAGLRTLLRQDPDVILVGEIRDAETAEMAIKASMTGHLVFSTLHTNSALGAIPRLVDLGIDPYLIEDSLIGVLAQRLVRTICSLCGAPAEPTPAELEFLEGDPGRMRRGRGCAQCDGTGFAGRSTISELFLPDDSMADLMRSGTNLLELRRSALAAGFQDMRADGIRRVREGATTVSEVLRVNRSHRLSAEERQGAAAAEGAPGSAERQAPSGAGEAAA